MKKKENEYQELWHDFTADKFFIVKRDKIVETDFLGNLKTKFHAYCSGNSSFRGRSSIANDQNGAFPKIDTKLLEGRKSVAPISKLDGYAQFPRPSVGFSLIQNSPVKNSHALSTIKLLSLVNQSASQRRNKSKNSCSYFLDKKSKSLIKKNQAERSTISNQTIQSSQSGRDSLRSTFLRKRQTLHNSGLKFSYMPKVKDTFRSRYNLNSLIEEDDIKDSNLIHKSYRDISEDLKRQELECNLDQPQIIKEKLKVRISYNVQFPSEGELHEKGRELRKAINPKAYEEELRREKKDQVQLQKKRNNNALRDKLLKAMLRARERKDLFKKIRIEDESTNNKIEARIQKQILQKVKHRRVKSSLKI